MLGFIKAVFAILIPYLFLVLTNGISTGLRFLHNPIDTIVINFGNFSHISLCAVIFVLLFGNDFMIFISFNQPNTFILKVEN